MIPYLLAVLGGYLIGDSIGEDIDKKIPEFAEGGLSDQLEKVRAQRDKRRIDGKYRYIPDIPVYLIEKKQGRIVLKETDMASKGIQLPIYTEIPFIVWESQIKNYVRDADIILKDDLLNDFTKLVDMYFQNPYNINNTNPPSPNGKWYHINNKLQGRGMQFSMQDALQLANKIVYDNDGDDLKAIVLPSNLPMANFVRYAFQIKDYDILDDLTETKYVEDASEVATVPKFYSVYVNKQLPVNLQEKYQWAPSRPERMRNLYKADGGMMAKGEKKWKVSGKVYFEDGEEGTQAASMGGSSRISEMVMAQTEISAIEKAIINFELSMGVIVNFDDLYAELQMADGGMMAKGGETGQITTAKYYWNKFDKQKRIEFLVSAGYSKSVSNDLSSESWSSLEEGVHKKLRAVLMADGGMMADGGEVGNVIVTEYASQNDYEQNESLREMAFNDFQEADTFARLEHNRNGRKFVIYYIPTRQYFHFGIKPIYADGGMMAQGGTPDDMDEELVYAHLKEIRRTKADVFNLGYSSGEGYIESKTSENKYGNNYLYSEITNGKVTHEWSSR